MDFLKTNDMKKMILFLLLSAYAGSELKAQTFAEWFQQKKTQKEYLVQQIAALGLYIGYVEKGYQIAQQGLSTVSDFTKGEFDLQGDYFSSLKTVNPVIKQNEKISVFVALLVKITKTYQSTYQLLSNSNTFSKDELGYIQSVFKNLLNDCDKSVDELITVITDKKLEMTDDERIARIEKLFLEMQEKYIFSKSFSADAKSIAASRQREKSDVQTSRALHGIKNH